MKTKHVQMKLPQQYLLDKISGMFRSLFLIFLIVCYSFDLTNTNFKYIKLEYATVIFDIVFVVDIVCSPRDQMHFLMYFPR